LTDRLEKGNNERKGGLGEKQPMLARRWQKHVKKKDADKKGFRAGGLRTYFGGREKNTGRANEKGGVTTPSLAGRRNPPSCDLTGADELIQRGETNKGGRPKNHELGENRNCENLNRRGTNKAREGVRHRKEKDPN